MLLEARDLTKTYRKGSEAFCALDQVSISVDDAECVGVIGESGSGKSTLANVLVGLEAADAGSVAFQGVRVDAAIPPARRNRAVRAAFLDMQMVFQNPVASFSDRMRVGRGIMEGLAYREGVSRDQAQTRMLEALDMVGLPRAYAHKYAWELSGGQCQRAAIARAIIARPKLLICDEPTSALDVTVQAQVIELLRSLCTNLSMACLFISHDLVLVHGFCSRIYVMNKGQVVEAGPARELFNHPQNEYTKRLIDAVITL